MNEKELQESLDITKIHLMRNRNAAFISTILFNLKIEWEESKNITSIGVNNDLIKINPEFWADFDKEQRAMILLHAAWHVALLHVINIHNPRLNKGKYALAADYAVNGILVESGYQLLDKMPYKPEYKGMSTMEIYNMLPDGENNDDNQNNNDPMSGDLNQPLANPSNNNQSDTNNNQGANSSQSPSAEQLKQAEDKIKNKIAKANTAQQMNKQVGNLPGEMQALVDEIVDPKLPWNVILQNFMSAFAKDDYSFKRPNKRFMPEFYLPSLYSEGMGHAAMAVDTSCSVTDQELAFFVAEMKKIKETLNPEKMTIVDFDTEVKNIHVFNREESLDDLRMTGRGGTNLYPAFEYFKDNQPEFLIVFSDLECHPIMKDPGFPVFWICINNPNAEVNFGELIHYDTSHLNNY